ncbi:MAG TPA: hypothetical protein VL966_13435 [Alphaproteobacteria bacterium]|jgi:hypothetical protein|nr:hypothetical protein [Alphaproteobacteria bacterium]
MSLKRIHLELARTKEFPEGSAEYGYDFRAPLGPDGHIDAEAWRAAKDQCTVRHFRPDENDENGYLIRTARGTWAFSYAPGEDDDEPFFRFEAHAFKEGEYVSITGHDGQLLPFKVISVR